MNDTPAAVPNSQVIAAGAASPIASMTSDAIAAEYAVVQGQLARNTSPHAKAPLLNRLEALAAARWPSSAAPGALSKGDASGLDPRNEEAFKQALASDSHADRANALNHLERFEQAEGMADLPATQADLDAYDEAVQPRGASDYQMANVPNGPDWLPSLLLEMGVPPQAWNLIAPSAAKIKALPDAEYRDRVSMAEKAVRANPGGHAIVHDAIGYANAVPDGHPLEQFIDYALSSPAGWMALASMARTARKRAAS